MKKSGMLAIIGFVGLGLISFALAQPQGRGKGGPGWGMGRIYDTKTVETLKGEIASVDTVASGRKDIPGRITLSLKTEKETAMVYLGPVTYIDQQGVKLAAKDKVEVKGSRVTMEGKPLIIANYVKKGDKTLKLRDNQGMPLWQRARRGPPGKW